MENTRGWVIVVGVLVIFAMTALAIVWVVRDTILRTVSPVQDATGNIGTRVASFMNPTPTILPDPVTIVRDVRALSRLETIQYSVEKVITAESGQGTFAFLFGDKLIFVAHGKVLAGIDMSKLGPDDIQVVNGVLYVKLPDPEIFITALDNEKSYVYNRDTGALTHGDVNLETTARGAAENEIEKAAIEDGILPQARQNAENFLYRFFRDLGFQEVIFVGSNNTPQVAPELQAAPTLQVIRPTIQAPPDLKTLMAPTQ